MSKMKSTNMIYIASDPGDEQYPIVNLYQSEIDWYKKYREEDSFQASLAFALRVLGAPECDEYSDQMVEIKTKLDKSFI